MNKSLAACVALIVAGMLSMSVSISAQKIDVPMANASATIEQCRNGGTGAAAVNCDNGGGGLGWVTGNAGYQNSHWAEDQYLPYRMTFDHLTTGAANVHTVTIGYDILKNGKHAIDYLGTYDATYANTFPCDGVAGCAGPTSTILIPKDNITVTNMFNPYTNSPIDQPDGVFTMWGGNLLTIAYEPYAGGEERQITLTFTASVSNPVLSWSGHVAYGGDWGAGNSAGGISGSPYHMRLKALDGSGGNQDLSLSADAVVVSAIVNIVKVVNTVDGSGSAFTAFPFTASTSFGTTSFSLVDDNAGPGVDTKQSQSITSFGATNTVTVTETSTPGWTLSDLTCTTNGVGSFTTNLATATVNVIPNAGGVVTCTYTNSQLTITAAPANITGRVLTDSGSGIRGAVLTLTNLSTGEVRSVRTNNFGYYTFTDAMTDDVYNLTVGAKRYTFVNNSRTFTLRDSLAGMDFVSITRATQPGATTIIEAPALRTVKKKVDTVID